MKQATYLTFDLGTTGMKAALVADNGRVLAVHTLEYTAQAPQPGWAEMAPDTYWHAAVTGTRAVLTKTSADPSRVQAIGFSSQGQTFLPINPAGQLGILVERPACTNAASLGAALLAAVGIRRFASIGKASEAWYRPERVFEPDASWHAAYCEGYERYLRLQEKVYGDSPPQLPTSKFKERHLCKPSA